MKVLLAGGGTAGHINPAVAIAKMIQKQEPDSKILFVGKKNSMEETLVQKEGFSIAFIEIAGLKHRLSLENIKIAAQAVKGVSQAKKIVRDFGPDVVIGTGGYVSGPVVFAAQQMGIRTVIHEQNVIPGLTTKLVSKAADKICISFEPSRAYFKQKDKLVLTGNPVRGEFFALNRSEARTKLGLDSRPFVFATGGSLGAETINQCMVELIKKQAAEKQMQIVLAAGKTGYPQVMKQLAGIELGKHIKIFEYIYNMHDYIIASDIVVSRSGAITCAELTAVGRPAVLIPSPNVANNHQEFNAKAIADGGGAVMVKEDENTIINVLYEVKKLVKDEKRRSIMQDKSYQMGIRNSANIIYQTIRELLT